MLEDFVDDIEHRRLNAGGTAEQAAKDRSNHRSYVWGYYNLFDDITSEGTETLCTRRDAAGLRRLLTC